MTKITSMSTAVSLEQLRLKVRVRRSRIKRRLCCRTNDENNAYRTYCEILKKLQAKEGSLTLLTNLRCRSSRQPKGSTMSRLAALLNKKKSSSAPPVSRPPSLRLHALENPGILRPAPSQAARRHSARLKRKMEEHDGKSIKEALEIQRSKVKAIDLSNPTIQPALEELGLGQQGRFASQVKKGYEEQMAATLSVDSDNKLPQQNNNLTAAQVLQKNANAAYRGGGPRVGNNVGYTNGELGTTTNGQGKDVDAARQKAQKAIYNAESSLKEHNEEKSLNLATKIPVLVLNQGKKGQMPAGSIQLIDKNDDPIDHRNTTKKQYRKLVSKARGIELKNSASQDAFLAQIYPTDASKAGKTGRGPKWTALRQRFNRACQVPGAEMKFEVERFDDDGVLPGFDVVGSRHPRRKLAKYRFRLTDGEQSFEY